MSDSESESQTEAEYTGVDKYRLVAEGEKYFRGYLSDNKVVYQKLGSTFVHLVINEDMDEHEAKQLVVKTYRQGKTEIKERYPQMDLTKIENKDFISEQLSEYVTYKLVRGEDNPHEALELLSWKVNAGLDYIAEKETPDDPQTQSMNSTNNPIVADGGVDVETSQGTSNAIDNDYDNIKKFISKGLDKVAEEKSEEIFDTIKYKIPDGERHRTKDSFEKLIKSTIERNKDYISEQSASRIQREMEDPSTGRSFQERIKDAAISGVVSNIVRNILEELYNRGKAFAEDVYESLKHSDIMEIITKISNFISDNWQIIIAGIAIL